MNTFSLIVRSGVVRKQVIILLLWLSAGLAQALTVTVMLLYMVLLGCTAAWESNMPLWIRYALTYIPLSLYVAYLFLLPMPQKRGKPNLAQYLAYGVFTKKTEESYERLNEALRASSGSGHRTNQ